MKKRGLTWDEKINAYLRRREIRQARKHEAWLASVQPRLLAREWQGGSAYSFATVPSVYVLTSEDDAMPGGRLTLTSGVPVTTGDVSGATAFYYTPYLSNQITLFDGSAVRQFTFGQTFVSNPATTNLPFDVFAYPFGGGISIETVSWVNDTTRAQAIAYANGFLSKNSDNTRRYLGTLRTGAVAGQVDDAVLTRHVWNMYNRVNRDLLLSDLSAHTYGTSSWRQWNANAADQFSFVIGVQEDASSISIVAGMWAGVAGSNVTNSAGLDTTTTPIVTSFFVTNANLQLTMQGADLFYKLPVGRHFLAAIEFGNASGPPTNYSVVLSAVIRM